MSTSEMEELIQLEIQGIIPSDAFWEHFVLHY